MSAEALDAELRLAALLWASPLVRPLWERWQELALPEAWLGAGAVAQTVWNALGGFGARHGIRDLDVVYWDPGDLSAAREAAHERRLRAAFASLGVPLDVKNQARVHLWYGERFGRAIAPHASLAAAVATWPSTATCVAVRPVWAMGPSRAGGRSPAGETTAAPCLEVCAPFGLEDLLAGRVRPNRVLVSEAVYGSKAARWRACWPGLAIEPWTPGARRAP